MVDFDNNNYCLDGIDSAIPSLGLEGLKLTFADHLGDALESVEHTVLGSPCPFIHPLFIFHHFDLRPERRAFESSGKIHPIQIG